MVWFRKLINLRTAYTRCSFHVCITSYRIVLFVRFYLPLSLSPYSFECFLNIYNNTEFKAAKNSRIWSRVLPLLNVHGANAKLYTIAIAEWIFMRNDNNAVLILFGWTALQTFYTARSTHQRVSTHRIEQFTVCVMLYSLCVWQSDPHNNCELQQQSRTWCASVCSDQTGWQTHVGCLFA